MSKYRRIAAFALLTGLATLFGGCGGADAVIGSWQQAPAPITAADTAGKSEERIAAMTDFRAKFVITLVFAADHTGTSTLPSMARPNGRPATQAIVDHFTWSRSGSAITMKYVGKPATMTFNVSPDGKTATEPEPVFNTGIKFRRL